MSELIQGKLLASTILEKAKARIAKLKTPPGLAAILVGDDQASRLYVNLKEKAAKDVGIYFEKFELPSDASTAAVKKVVKSLNERPDIHGILVQFPLPDQDEDAVVASIDANKDVDGFHPDNRKKLAKGEPSLVPPVALAVVRLIQASNQPLSGKSAVIVSNSEIFAEPIIKLLEENAVGAVRLPRDESALAAKTRAADIIVVAVGQAGFLTADMVKPGAIVIDVGTNKVDGKLVGDSAADLMGHAGFISPVPGGVGPLTVAYLMNNVLKAAVSPASRGQKRRQRNT